jgi:hypothetical protein
MRQPGVLRRLCRKTNSSRYTWSWALLTLLVCAGLGPAISFRRPRLCRLPVLPLFRLLLPRDALLVVPRRRKAVPMTPHTPAPPPPRAPLLHCSDRAVRYSILNN